MEVAKNKIITIGITGKQASSGHIEESFSFSIIIGTKYLGGIVGVGEGLVENCFTNGTLNINSKGSFVGGLVGVIDSGKYFSIHNCYTLMKIDDRYGKNNIGNIIGGVEEQPFNYSFYNLFFELPGYDEFGEAKTSNELKQSSTYSNWATFDDYWLFNGSNSYPKLKWEASNLD